MVRITDERQAEIVATGLVLPVAMEFGPDGALYVASPVFGADRGEGSILRLDLSGVTPIDASRVHDGPRCQQAGAAAQ